MLTRKLITNMIEYDGCGQGVIHTVGLDDTLACRWIHCACQHVDGTSAGVRR
jgi:hypothetical protein